MARLLVDLGPLRRHRNIRLLVGGQLVSLLGSSLTIVAVPYQVYRETHSSLWVGLASLIQLPFLILGSLWGGAMGDRLNRRTLLVASALVLGVLSAGLALNAQITRAHFVTLLVLAAFAAGAGGFAGPIRSATIPRLVEGDELVATYSINQVVMNVATVVGPAIAGVLLASGSWASGYGRSAASVHALAGATRSMSSLPASAEHAGVAVLAAISDGVSYVRRHAVAQAVYLADLNAMVFGLPRALFPAVALTMYHAGPRTLGLLYAAPGAGALLMALVTGWIARVRRRGRLVVISVAAWGGAMAIFGLVRVAWVGLACLAFAGAMDVISTVLRNTILQMAITDEFRSRVSSIQMAVVTGGPRLGDLESGVVASLSTTEFSIVSGGIACIVGVIALARWRPAFWRDAVDE